MVNIIDQWTVPLGGEAWWTKFGFDAITDCVGDH